jgi:outer membrane usher protein
MQIRTNVGSLELRSVPSTGMQDPAEVWLAIYVNQQDLHETALLLRQKDGPLHARAGDLRRWRLRLPNAQPLFREAQAYYSLNAINGLSYRVDEARQALLIEAPASAFQSTHLNGLTDNAVVPTPSPLGGFLNYDFFAQYLQGRGEINSLIELGAFNSFGIVVSNLLLRDISADPHFIRLDTTWTLDKPERMASLRLGDTISRAGIWGRSVRMGGGSGPPTSPPAPI